MYRRQWPISHANEGKVLECEILYSFAKAVNLFSFGQNNGWTQL